MKSQRLCVQAEGMIWVKAQRVEKKKKKKNLNALKEIKDFFTYSCG